jgi:hypothetical protein
VDARLFCAQPELAERFPSKTNQARLAHWSRIATAEWCEVFGPLARSFTVEETYKMDNTSLDHETVAGRCEVVNKSGRARARAP